MSHLSPLPLPAGISARTIEDVNGLRMHVLEAGDPRHRLVLLLHGFPELAYSWRKVMPELAGSGYHVVAPDQRGYGRTTGWANGYDTDLSLFRLLNLARDAFGLVRALGHDHAACVVGHDFGSPVAAWSALVRPDVFRSVVLMSAPFAGPPSLHVPPPGLDIHAALAALPRPRKHYQWYYATRPADADMRACLQGIHNFLRAYYHMKSADWPGNRPVPLAGWTAEALAVLPTYYIMDLELTMAETVAPELPSAAQIATCRWLPDAELRVYSEEFGRTGFQGGLNWYRCRMTGIQEAELGLFAGRTIDVPSLFLAGVADWGIRQVPGALERMQHAACTEMRGCHLIEGAGHWVQQEQPEATAAALLKFLCSLPS
jgi:pimeloyl-ACP methyl ester carboxylesterase